MNFDDEFPSKKIGFETVIEFDYPLNRNQDSGFVPSLRQVLMRAFRPTTNGIFIADSKLIEEAIAWVRSHVREGFYRMDGRYSKIVCQSRDGEEVMVDGEGVRWGAMFRFLKDEDAVLFAMRFA